MISTQTTYMGLKLKSPVIVSSSGLTSSVDNMALYEAAGAGAVVIKSIFEEQICGEVSAAVAAEDYPEAADYLNSYISNNDLEKHLDIVRTAKKRLGIPVIASINAKSGGGWLSYASRMAEAGADALELNLFYMPQSASESAARSMAARESTASAGMESSRADMRARRGEGCHVHEHSMNNADNMPIIYLVNLNS